MVQPALQQSEDCWYLPISKSFTTRAPRFQLGQLIHLDTWFQIDAGVTHYGSIVGIHWDAELDDWSYSIAPPTSHRYYPDVEVVWEDELAERLGTDQDSSSASEEPTS